MIQKVKVTIKKCMGDAPESEWPVEWEGFADWDGRQAALPETGIKSNGEYKLYFDTAEGLETVSEMTALERIAQALLDIREYESPEADEEFVDIIIDIVRQAFLDDRAAVAFTGSAEGVMVGEYRRDMSDALDAAFGPARSDVAG